MLPLSILRLAYVLYVNVWIIYCPNCLGYFAIPFEGFGSFKIEMNRGRFYMLFGFALYL